MPKLKSGGSQSSEDGITVSDDPVLDAPGLMGFGDEYVPSRPVHDVRPISDDVEQDSAGPLMGDQYLYDDDDQGSPCIVTSR